MSCPSDLKNLYRDGRLIPFIGAGVSASVRWIQGAEKKHGPSWGELVDQAARLIGFQDPDLLRVRGSDLQILEYFRDLNSGSAAMLTNWLLQNMHPSDDDLLNSPIHAQLSKLTNCPLLYTTNYDDFIERSFALHTRECRVIAKEADMGADTGVTEIVKFHGDLNHPDQMVLSESDYERRLTLSTAMDYRLRADILGRALLFLGYSFRDWNVSYLFRLVNEQFKNLPVSLSGKRAYIAIGDPSDFERHLFKTRNIEVIAISGRDLTEETARLLEEVRS